MLLGVDVGLVGVRRLVVVADKEGERPGAGTGVVGVCPIAIVGLARLWPTATFITI